jgi:RNA polymerase sigma-B factor
VTSVHTRSVVGAPPVVVPVRHRARPDGIAAAGGVHAPVPANRAAGRHEYEHLAPLFAERADLPDGDPQRERLRAELIAGYLPVARNIARKHSLRGDHFDDLMQVASVGLVLAVDRFDADRGIEFLAFAVPTITGEVLRYFRDRATTIRLPRRLRQLQAQIYDAATELAQRHGRAARPSEIARHLGVGVEVVLEGLAAQGAGQTSSLDEQAHDTGGDSTDMTRFAAALGEIEPEFDLVEHREALAPLLAELPERERRILLMRFFGEMTQTEIGQQIGISQMHVSRLLSKTLARLRRQLTTD